MIIGIIIGEHFHGFTIIVCLTSLFLSSFLIVKTNAYIPTLIILFLFTSLGYLSIQPFCAPIFPSNHVIHFADGKKYWIEGILLKIYTHKKRVKIILQTTKISDQKVCGLIRVTVYAKERNKIPECKFQKHDQIKIHAKLKKPRNFNNPGGFDYQRYLAFKKIWVTSNLNDSNIKLTQKYDKPYFDLDQIRKKIAAFIDHESKTKKVNAIIKALIIGDRSGISSEQRQIFNRSGTSHLLAISGLHIGIIATVSFLFFKWLAAQFNELLWRGLVFKTAAVLSIFPVIGYGLLAGMSPSTQRAVVMVCIFLWWRKAEAINSLGIAATIILMINPPGLFSISFQLSFAAVGVILYGLHLIPAGEFKSNFGDRVRQWFFGSTIVSLLAILGTLPVTMRYFNQVPMMSLVSNLICIPLIGFAVVPLGLTSICLLLVSLDAAELSMSLTKVILEKSLLIINFLGQQPLAAFQTFTPSILEICCYYIAGWCLFNLKTVKYSKRILLVLLVIIGADIYYWMHQRFWHQDLRITIVDVHHGSAAFVEVPGSKILILDGGGFYDNDIFDVGENIMAPLLWRHKIMTIDTLILSHADADHINGFLYLATKFKVKSLWDSGYPAKNKEYHQLRTSVRQQSIATPNFAEMDRELEINKLKIKILYPPSNFLLNDYWKNKNDNSIVVKLTFGKCSFLFPGDITARAEKKLVELKGDELRSNVLIAPHHGSKTSSSKIFLEHVNPETVIISAGTRFKTIPHPRVLKKYRQQGCQIWMTKQSGAIQISTDGNSFTINPFLN